MRVKSYFLDNFPIDKNDGREGVIIIGPGTILMMADFYKWLRCTNAHALGMSERLIAEAVGIGKTALGEGVRSPLIAASATFALKAGVWFRRGRLLIGSPDSLGTACPLSGKNSTYRPVQILEAGSYLRYRPPASYSDCRQAFSSRLSRYI
jgi:hypothetical protein